MTDYMVEIIVAAVGVVGTSLATAGLNTLGKLYSETVRQGQQLETLNGGVDAMKSEVHGLKEEVKSDSSKQWEKISHHDLEIATLKNRMESGT